MKSAEGKNAWRALIKEFSDEKMVKDHNFGTLVRKDCRGDYTEENSIFSEYPDCPAHPEVVDNMHCAICFPISSGALD